MKNNNFLNTLTYCLYVSYNEELLIELKLILSKYLSGISEDKDYNRVFEIEKIIFKNK